MERKVNSKTLVPVYVLAALLAATSVIYFLASTEELPEAGEETAAALESTLFIGSGVGYAIITTWVLAKRAKGCLVPYVVSIAGSVFLIALYVSSRTFSLPVVGLQEDIGFLDVSCKVLQGAIIGLATSVLITNKSLTAKNVIKQ